MGKFHAKDHHSKAIERFAGITGKWYRFQQFFRKKCWIFICFLCKMLKILKIYSVKKNRHPVMYPVSCKTLDHIEACKASLT